jgi:hypothetical protein
LAAIRILTSTHIIVTRQNFALRFITYILALETLRRFSLMADYSDFQKLLLEGDEKIEAVTVNQRAMIGNSQRYLKRSTH